MRHRKHTFKLGRTGAHRKALLANMAASLLLNGQIKTTVPKAKELRRFVEKLITLGKKGTLHARRQAIAKMQDNREKDESVAAYLFTEVAPKYKNREGGYTRIIRLANRRLGDGAEMCIIQLVEEDVAKKTSTKKKAAKKEEAPVVEEPKAEEAAATEEVVEEKQEEKAEA